MTEGTNHEQTEVQQEIAEALYKLIEDHTKMVDVATQSEALCRGSECAVDLFSARLKRIHKPEKPRADKNVKVKRMRGNLQKTASNGNGADVEQYSSTESSSDDEEDTKLKMLAAIAVSPDDLSTSNMVKKLGTR